jgi:DNA repair protein RadC
MNQEKITFVEDWCNEAAFRNFAFKEMVRRLELYQPLKNFPDPICSSIKAFEVFSYLSYEEQEVVAIACLNSANQLTHLQELFRGSVSSSPSDLREILRTVLRESAVRFLIAHNHPSGNTDPSDEDKEFTKKLVKAAKLVGVPLLDHLIVGKGNHYYSFTDHRLCR